MKKTLALILALVMVFALCACGNSGTATPSTQAPTGGNSGAPSASGEKINLKFSTSTSETSTWTLAAYHFADLVSEASGGNITVDVYSSDQLSGGDQSKGIELLMDGSTDMTFHSNLVYSKLDDRFNVISLPWMFDDFEDVDTTLAGAAGDALKDILLEKGILCLGFGENGFREITNNVREIKTVDDFKGVKFRVNNSNMLISTYKCLGADPTSMNWSEVFTALQQGAIDGQENPTDVISSSAINEVQKYMSLWDCTYDALILGFNKETFDSLSPEYQQIITDSAKQCCEYQIELNRSNVEEQLAAFAEGGMTITQKADMDMENIMAAVKPVYVEYETIIGSDLLALFQG